MSEDNVSVEELSIFDKTFLSTWIDVSEKASRFVEQEMSSGRMTIKEAVICQRDMIQKQVPHFRMSLEQVCRQLSPQQEKQFRSQLDQL